jgi:dihydrolipoamide dehydrogenase
VDVGFDGNVEKPEQTFDRVLVAIGRKPNRQKVGLEKTKVRVNQQGFVRSV